MRKFDTKVQHLKYKVLREVARLAWEDKLLENIMDIPAKLAPGKEATMRCCVYKERAILNPYIINIFMIQSVCNKIKARCCYDKKKNKTS